MVVPIWKRSLDILVSAIALVIFSPLFALIAVLIKLDSRGPVFFFQERVGRGLRPFFIWKFRTMVVDAASKGRQITADGDPRITRVGRVLRKMKFDEIPQLVNVLRGDMSLVGPRPEVPRYVEMFRRDYEEILCVRPGITDFASVKYCDEGVLLMHAPDPEREYVTHVLPDKILLAKEYVRKSSFVVDVSVIAQTIRRLILP